MNSTTASCGCQASAVGAPGSPARAKTEGQPCERCRTAADEIQYDIAITPGSFPEAVLIGELRRLRGILDRCWFESGLLGPNMTGNEAQAWEEPSDLEGQISELWSDAQSFRESEGRETA